MVGTSYLYSTNCIWVYGFLSDAKTAKNLEILGPSGSLVIEEGAPLTKNCLLGVLQHT